MAWRVLIEAGRMRVSKPGIDVFNATNYKDLIFDSDLQTHGVFVSGLLTSMVPLDWYSYQNLPPAPVSNAVGRQAYGAIITYSNPLYPGVPHILAQQLRPDGSAEGQHMFGWYVVNSNGDFVQKGPSEGFLMTIKQSDFAIAWFINPPANSGGVLTYPVRYHIMYGAVANFAS